MDNVWFLFVTLPKGAVLEFFFIWSTWTLPLVDESDFKKFLSKKSTYSIYNLLNYHGGFRYHLFLSFRRPFSLNSIITLCSEVFSHFKSKTSLKYLVFHSLDNGFSWFIGNCTLKHLKGMQCSIYLSPALLWILLASV